MKRSTVVAAISTALLGLGVTATADEKVDQAVKELEAKFAKIDSYTAKTKTMTDTEFGPGHSQKSEMSGTAEWVRKGEKALMRSDTKCVTVKTEDGKKTTTPSIITTVNDSEFQYVLIEEGGKKKVTKTKAQPAQAYHPMALFKQYQAYHDIKLLPDEAVHGQDCYVFEMKMKAMEGAPPTGRQVLYYQKDNGIVVKSEGFDGEGKLISSSMSMDVKINVSISEDRFKFDIPEGAEVFDQTSMQEQQPPSETEEEEPEEEQAEKEEPQKPEKKKPKIPKLPKLP